MSKKKNYIRIILFKYYIYLNLNDHYSCAEDHWGSIWNVKDELQKLKDIVSTVQAVLLDAEEM